MTRIKMFVDVDDQERICLRNTGVQRVEETSEENSPKVQETQARIPSIETQKRFHFTSFSAASALFVRNAVVVGGKSNQGDSISGAALLRRFRRLPASFFHRPNPIHRQSLKSFRQPARPAHFHPVH